ncbi:uncharacterized protein LOC126895887 [Daktulosphaira vitifoliae]|uniref:uncharacterized protein LOC126895887 n=1 Tax=Daktulosphaira vitifoliae TaxID=58002 RepID=UPI0021A9ACDF|nr:uncharacterized protein LOC126895887 [Daktulosphaira vitifoliae]
MLNGTSKSQAEAIYQTLVDWGLTNHVKAMSFNTTATNSGRIGGTCVLLEQWLEKNILYFPCHHHIYEIILKCTFHAKFGVTSGPNVPLFLCFQKSWPKINTENYKSGIDDRFIFEKLQSSIDHILEFCLNQLKLSHFREDYREFLELTVIFLNGVPPRGVLFRAPGAIHHARWMSKALYTLKIFIFREEFKLTQKKYNSISRICIFLVNLYIKV